MALRGCPDRTTPRSANYIWPHWPGTSSTCRSSASCRKVVGDQTYESLARKGETMTTSAMATYGYDQIDQARAELNAVSEYI